MMMLFRSMPRRTWAAAVLLAAAFAGCGDPTGPLPREGAPDELRFTIGGFGSGSTTVVLDGEAVMVTRVPWDYMTGVPIVPVRVVPTAQAWRDFWAAAEEAGVRRWRSEYMAEGVVDGSGWSLRIVADGVVVDSHGSNAWPDRRGREHEMDVTADFQAFLDAVGTLAGQDF